MKIVFGTLLFTSVVFFNSIVLSSQMNNNARHQGGNNNPRVRQVTVRTRTILHTEAGQRFVLPNGNIYVSNGYQPISMFYNVADQIVRVHQPPNSPANVLRRGPFVGPSCDDWPGTFTYQEEQPPPPPLPHN